MMIIDLTQLLQLSMQPMRQHMLSGPNQLALHMVAGALLNQKEALRYAVHNQQELLAHSVGEYRIPMTSARRSLRWIYAQTPLRRCHLLKKSVAVLRNFAHWISKSQPRPNSARKRF